MFEKILLAVDGSDAAGRATGTAAEFAIRFRGEVVVVHAAQLWLSVGDPGSHPTDVAGEARQILDAAVSRLRDGGIEARGELRHDPAHSAAEAILGVAQTERVDAIVMGTRGLSDWSGLLIGSTAHKVLQASTVPVLVVR